MHTYTRQHTYVFEQYKDLCKYVYTYICIYAYTYIRTWKHTHLPTYTKYHSMHTNNTCTHGNLHTCTHTCVHTPSFTNYSFLLCVHSGLELAAKLGMSPRTEKQTRTAGVPERTASLAGIAPSLDALELDLHWAGWHHICSTLLLLSFFFWSIDLDWFATRRVYATVFETKDAS